MSEGKPNEGPKRAPTVSPGAPNPNTKRPAATNLQQHKPSGTKPQQDLPVGDRSTRSPNTTSVPTVQQTGPRSLQSYEELCNELLDLWFEPNTYFYIGGTRNQKPVGQDRGPESKLCKQMLECQDLLKRENDGFYFTTDGGTSKKELIDIYLNNPRCLNRKRGEEKRYNCIYVMVYRLNVPQIMRKLIRLYIKDLTGDEVDPDIKYLDIFQAIAAQIMNPEE